MDSEAFMAMVREMIKEKYIGEKLKNDPAFMKKTVNYLLSCNKDRYGYDLRHGIRDIVGDMVDNKEFIFQLLNGNKGNHLLQALINGTIKYEHPSWANDVDFLKKLVPHLNGFDSFDFHLGQALKNKEEICELVKICPGIMSGIKSDKDLICELVKINPGVVGKISNNLRNDKNFIYELLKINRNVIDYVGDKILYDKQFYFNVLEKDPLLILNLRKWLSRTSTIEYRETCAYAPDLISEHEEKQLILNSLSSNDASLIFSGMIKDKFFEKYILNSEYVLKAISSDIRTLNIIDQELKETAKRDLLNSIIKNENSDECFKNEIFCQTIIKNKEFLTNDSMVQVLKELQKYSEENNYIIESINLNYDEQQIAKKLGFDIENEKIKIERKKSDENSNITNNENSEIIDNNIPKNSYGVANNNYNSFNNEDKYGIKIAVKYPSHNTGKVSKETIEQLRASLYDENGNLYDVSTFAGGYSDRENKLRLLKEYEKNYNSNDNRVTFAIPKKVYGSKLSYEKKSEANEKKKQNYAFNLNIQGKVDKIPAEYVCLQYEDGEYHDCYVYDYDKIEDLDCQYISYFDDNKKAIMYAPIKLENGELLKQEHTQEMIDKIAMYQNEKLLKNKEFGGLDINSLPTIINHSKCYETIAMAAAGSNNNGNGPEEISVSTPIVDDNNNLNNNWYNNGNNVPKKENDKEEKQGDSITELINLIKANNDRVNNLYEEIVAIKKENEMLQSKLLEKLNGGKQI